MLDRSLKIPAYRLPMRRIIQGIGYLSTITGKCSTEKSRFERLGLGPRTLCALQEYFLSSPFKPKSLNPQHPAQAHDAVSLLVEVWKDFKLNDTKGEHIHRKAKISRKNNP